MISSIIYSRWEKLVDTIKNEYSNSKDTVIVGIAACKSTNTYISYNSLNEKKLYIEFDAGVLDSYRLPKLTGLRFETAHVDMINKNKKYLIISSIETSITEEAFEAFSASVVSAIEDIENEKDVLQKIDAVVTEYSDFFNPEKEKAFSHQEEQGLFGELCFLQDLIIRKGESAVYCWSGPQKNKFDFVFKTNKAVEIKTTSNQTQLIVQISNENQLCDEGLDELYLNVYVIETNPSGKNLLSIVNEIIQLLPSYQMTKVFKEKLVEYGFNYKKAEPKFLFKIIRSHVFLVGSDFPKIVKSDINPAISEVKYKVNLTGIREKTIEYANI